MCELVLKVLNTPVPVAADDSRMSDLANENRKLGIKVRATLKKEQVRNKC